MTSKKRMNPANKNLIKAVLLGIATVLTCLILSHIL